MCASGFFCRGTAINSTSLDVLFQAELRAIQASANGSEGSGERPAGGGNFVLGGAPSSSTGSLPSSSAEEMTGYNQEYLEHKLEELEEAVRREEIEKAKMEACLDLVRDVGSEFGG